MRCVCFCNSNIPWGGGEAWHLNAARSMAARGWRVLVICHPKGELIKRVADEPGVTAIPFHLGRLSFLNPFYKARMARLFKAWQVTAVIMNLPADLKLAGPAAQKAGVTHILYRRGSALPVRDSSMNRHLYGKVITGLIVNSKATLEQTLKNNPGLIDKSKISIIPNGVDIAAFDAALDKAGRETPLLSFPAGERPLVIGNAGRLNRQKAQHLLLYIGKELVEAGIDCRIVIAGTGERERELKELAQKLGLEHRTVFCGFMRDLSLFWLGIDVFVLTSLWEGFGNVLIEAGLAQKPVFAFAVSNVPELVDEGPEGNGRLFPLPDGLESAALSARGHAAKGATLEKLAPEQGWSGPVTAMAEALAALAKHPEHQRSMGRMGRRMALRYSQESCMDNLEELLR